MIDCCQRLVEHHGRLHHSLVGLTVRIGDKFQVDPIDGTLTIKWDWL